MPSFYDIQRRVRGLSVETNRLSIYELNLLGSLQDRKKYSSFYFQEGREFILYAAGPRRCSNILREMSRVGEERFAFGHLSRVAREGEGFATYFLACDAETQDPVLHLELSQDHLGNYRLSYYCAIDERGRGYASEGYQALSDVLAHLDVFVNFAEVPVKNTVSKDFLLRQGFRTVARVGSSVTNGGEFLNLESDCLWRDFEAFVQDEADIASYG